MNIDNLLSEMLELAEQFIEAYDDEQLIHEADTVRLAEMIVDMNKWLMAGGKPPDMWSQIYTVRRALP